MIRESTKMGMALATLIAGTAIACLASGCGNLRLELRDHTPRERGEFQPVVGVWTEPEIGAPIDDAPQTSTDASGNTFVVWQRYDSTVGGYEIVANHFQIGVGWDEPAVVSSSALWPYHLRARYHLLLRRR